MSDNKKKTKRELTLQTMALVSAIAGPYMPALDNLEDLKFEFDEQAGDCLMQMYFCMMTGDEKYYEAYMKLYNQLDDERKAYIDRQREYIIGARAVEEEKGTQKTIGREEDRYE